MSQIQQGYWAYRSVPRHRRVCEVCGNTILRNIAVYEGRLYHYGCLQREKSKTFRCHECFSTLNGLETGWSEANGRRVRVCGNCGSTGVSSFWEGRTG